jgi:hypothetical protein
MDHGVVPYICIFSYQENHQLAGAECVLEKYFDQEGEYNYSDAECGLVEAEKT